MSCLSLVARRGVEPLALFRHPRRALLPWAILTDRQQPKTNKYNSVKY